ncbi:MAG: 16S rRNA (guanine(966)-N(2))-methyltransferase RsmD [Thermodesulfobacteriota bacterium]|nr:16S rRNA (guanine(966)-N(2))-methyltransferase RsmD [Thermodesulfobacteriota bacterium]
MKQHASRLKVIGGRLKGTPLASPKGLTVRPTSAKVREAVANILQNELTDAVVLDLFAGTGALGIEALSRGAAYAVFIDNHPAALTTVRQNIHACDLAGMSHAIRHDPSRDLKCLAGMDLKFDVVFMDPPYAKDVIPATLTNIHTIMGLNSGAILVVEQSAKEATISDERSGIGTNKTQWTSHYRLTSTRQYGKTLVSFLEYMI